MTTLASHVSRIPDHCQSVALFKGKNPILFLASRPSSLFYIHRKKREWFVEPRLVFIWDISFLCSGQLLTFFGRGSLRSISSLSVPSISLLFSEGLSELSLWVRGWAACHKLWIKMEGGWRREKRQATGSQIYLARTEVVNKVDLVWIVLLMCQRNSYERSGKTT